MKYITVLRHANAVENTTVFSDFNRTLTEKGKENVKKISETILKNLPKIDIIVASSAIRTKQTAELLANFINFPLNKIKLTDRLYDSSSSYYFDALLSLSTTCHHILFVGHNPEISDFASLLINKNFNDLDKCEVANISIDTFNWNNVDMGTGKLLQRFKA